MISGLSCADRSETLSTTELKAYRVRLIQGAFGALNSQVDCTSFESINTVSLSFNAAPINTLLDNSQIYNPTSKPLGAWIENFRAVIKF